MFTLTSAAAEEILAAMPRSGAEGLALRVAARLEPDGSLAFGMGFDEAREGDMPLEIEGVPLLIAQPSQALLDDAMLDYVEVAPGRLDFVCVAQTPDEETPAPAPAGGCGSGGCNRCGG
ncbi:MAG: iron-sulfur cluster assembly accessory protein [Burkholderiaceae bacterium]|nr:iron-sulfur cluster assembly accessory protein [Burkholderiaceae bacterium]